MNEEEKQGKSWLLEFLTGVIFLAVATISNFAGWLLETLLEVWEKCGWEERRGVMSTFTVLLYHRSTAEAREIEAGKIEIIYGKAWLSRFGNYGWTDGAAAHGSGPSRGPLVEESR